MIAELDASTLMPTLGSVAMAGIFGDARLQEHRARVATNHMPKRVALADWKHAGAFQTERLPSRIGTPMLTDPDKRLPRSFAGQITRAMASSDLNSDRRPADDGMRTSSRPSTKPRRPTRSVRQLRLLQLLLRRDMERNGLSLRRAAREGNMALGTLANLLDRQRVTVLAKQPKRPIRRPTLLHVRSFKWIGERTGKVLDLMLDVASRREGR